MTETSSVSERPTHRRGSGPWWMWALLGALSVVAGIVILLRPSHSLATLAVVAGIFMLLESVVEVATTFRRRAEDRAASGLIAVLGVIVGVLLVRHPIPGLTGIALLIGIWLLAIGAVGLAWAVASEAGTTALVVAAVQTIAGIVIVAIPGMAFATLALLAGIAFVLNGLALLVLAWALWHAEVPPRPAAADGRSVAA